MCPVLRRTVPKCIHVFARNRENRSRNRCESSFCDTEPLAFHACTNTTIIRRLGGFLVVYTSRSDSDRKSLAVRSARIRRESGEARQFRLACETLGFSFLNVPTTVIKQPTERSADHHSAFEMISMNRYPYCSSLVAPTPEIDSMSRFVVGRSVAMAIRSHPGR